MDIDKVRNMTDGELLAELATQRRALYDLRFQLATRQLNDSNQLARTRRGIARILTVMTEREMSIAPRPRTRAQAALPVAPAAPAKPRRRVAKPKAETAKETAK